MLDRVNTSFILSNKAVQYEEQMWLMLAASNLEDTYRRVASFLKINQVLVASFIIS
jgi:hypothetical protein